MHSLTNHLPQILQRQKAINTGIDEPVTDYLAILLLSRPVQILEDGSQVLDFFGVTWTISPDARAAEAFESAQVARGCL